jgi:hypothetical protein
MKNIKNVCTYGQISETTTDKRQTQPLVREGLPTGQVSKCQTGNKQLVMIPRFGSTRKHTD